MSRVKLIDIDAIPDMSSLRGSYLVLHIAKELAEADGKNFSKVKKDEQLRYIREADSIAKTKYQTD